MSRFFIKFSITLQVLMRIPRILWRLKDFAGAYKGTGRTSNLGDWPYFALLHKGSLEVLQLGSGRFSEPATASLQATRANLVVSTPSRLIPHLSSGLIRLEAGCFHTPQKFDEADLILSFGFQSDWTALVPIYWSWSKLCCSRDAFWWFGQFEGFAFAFPRRSSK